ncbi:MAG: alcohol dehydrogenase [Planctomycetota bacterium]|nr:MAG: alcohol dehydrogenase [Planctomycetota bacterium]
MHALTLHHGQLNYQSNYAGRTPAVGTIPVDVRLAGICETDLQLVKGYMGFQGILGHEFVGIAREGRYAGQRVVGEINCSCHQCQTCRSGAPTHCPHRTVLGILNHDGAFADTLWLPEQNLHPIPDTVSDESAVFVEPLAAAFQIAAQLDLRRFPRSIVLGDGRLGNLCAQVLVQQGCQVTVWGKHRRKLERIAALGIATQLIFEGLVRQEADLVVDVTGSVTGLPLACQLVRPRGTIVLKTTVADPQGPHLAPLVIDEITLIGSRCGPFPPAIAALQDRLIHVEPLITGRFPLSLGAEAFQAATHGTHIKILLDPRG